MEDLHIPPHPQRCSALLKMLVIIRNAEFKNKRN
jgi:hypothetical protein